MLIITKNGAPEKDRNASVSAAEVIGRVVQHDQTWAKSEPTTKAGMASCIGSDMSIVGNIECKGPAQVFGRIEGELRASDLSRSAMAHRSRAASLRRTSQSAVASRAPSVPSASNCKTVARSRVTFFTGRCRSTRTLCLKGHHGESKIQRTYRRSRPRARKRKPCRTRPWLRICSALKHRHPPTGLSRRLSRNIRRSRTLPSGCAARGMRGAASSMCKVDLLRAGSAVTFGKTGLSLWPSRTGSGYIGAQGKAEVGSGQGQLQFFCQQIELNS